MNITPELHDRYADSLHLYAKSLVTMSLRLSPQRAASEVIEMLRHAHVRLDYDEMNEVVTQYRNMVADLRRVDNLPAATTPVLWARRPWRDPSVRRG